MKLLKGEIMKKYLFLIVIVFSLLLISSCKKYTVTFIMGDEKYVVSYKGNEPISFPEPVSIENLTFKHWEFNNKIIDSLVMPNEDVIIYGIYETTFKTLEYIIDGEVVLRKQYPLHEIVELEKDIQLKDASLNYWTYLGEAVTLVAMEEDIKVIGVVTKVDPHLALIDSFDLKSEEGSYIMLPNKYYDMDCSYNIANSFLPYLDLEGHVNRTYFDVYVPVAVTFNYNYLDDYKSVTKRITIKIDKLTDEEILDKVTTEYTFDNYLYDNQFSLRQDFSTDYQIINTKWTSNNPSYLNDAGKVIDYPLEDTNVTLSLELSLGEIVKTVTYSVIIPAISFNERVQKALEEVALPSVATGNLYLPTHFPYHVEGTWHSSNERIITSTGELNTKESIEVVLTLHLYIINEENGDIIVEKKQDFKILSYKREKQLVLNTNDLLDFDLENITIKDGSLVIKDSYLSGEITSKEINTSEFSRAVATIGAVTSKDAKAELKVSVYANGNWSKYLSYCPNGFGKGLLNKAIDDEDATAKLDTDEIIIKNGKLASKIRFKVILSRTSISTNSPELFLISCAFTLKEEEKINIDLSTLPKSLEYDVPRLYQNIVPSIGNSICSPTSCTMLLKYAGYDFKEQDTYEHRYIANLAKDYGHNIFGNWAYSTMLISSFGLRSYVGIMDSLEELIYHLANVGPCALSVRGQMTSDQKDYYTNGHLVVAIGYIIENGNIKIILNDSNVPNVRSIYDESVIRNTWR